MSFRERLLLAFAVFLMFGAFGPASILANSVLIPGSWTLLGVVVFLSGGMSATIILSMTRPWLLVPIVILFSLGIVHAEEIAGYISGRDESMGESISQQVVVTPEQLESVKQKRAGFFAIGALLIGSGWAMFVVVLNAEGRKRIRLQTEVNLAKEIQESLQPQDGFRASWCAIGGRTIPASEVGGDFYDVIPLSDSLIAVIVADVSGHGVKAGIISAMTKSALYAQLQKNPAPSCVLVSVNETLVQLIDDESFVTAAYLVLDRKKKRGTFATAGHPPLLFRSGGSVEKLRTPNLALGMKRGVGYKERSFAFRRDDSFLLYTDGIVEVMNRKGEEFGYERLLRSWPADRSSREACDQIIAQAREFAGSGEFKDDVTLVSVNLSGS